MNVKKMTEIALFATLCAILSQIAIPLPGLVPINLATLSVMLCGALLGAKWGAVSQLIYLALGVLGLPVFSGQRAGLGTLLGPTGGFLVGYVVMAVVIGLLGKNVSSTWMLPVSMVLGTLACYTCGLIWYMYSTQTAFVSALMACVVPFLLGDAVKILVASMVARRVKGIKYR